MKPNRPKHSSGLDHRLALMVYRWRWLAAIVVMIGIMALFSSGMGRVGKITASLTEISDTSNGGGAVEPQVFDPSLDVWFDTGDDTVAAYFDIEKKFIAEDYILVSFEDDRSPYGVFSKESLATVQRLTESFLQVPGVRHVRSLTYSPWIRWGQITDEYGSEPGLIIGDMVDTAPEDLSESEVVERMVAVLGAQRTAERLGTDPVVSVLGNNANFDDYMGESVMLGSIVNNDATATAIQIQIVRPNIENPSESGMAGDEDQSALTNNLYAVQFQRAALRGIEHYLNLEKGLAVKTQEYATLDSWINALPPGDEKRALRRELEDPTKNFMKDKDGNLVKKFHVYSKTAEGSYVEISDPAKPIEAPADFKPNASSPYEFRLGGVPILERNFEIVGKADSKYLPMMLLIIMIALVFAFRSVAGVVVPMTVVVASIMGTVGSIFLMGDLFNNLTAMIPNMLTAIGMADSIHLVAAWLLMRDKYTNKRDLIVEVIRKNALPVLLTSITTAIGFYSLVLSELTPVQQLGVSMTIGTVIAYLLSMTVVPALLSLFPLKKKQAKRRAMRIFTPERSDRLAQMVTRKRKPIVFYSFIITLAACSGLLLISIDADQRNMFPEDNPVMMDLTWIEDRLGGTGDLEIVFSSATDISTAPPLTISESELLADLQIRKARESAGMAGVSRLTPEELGSLASLEEKYERWNRSRIGVSSEFLQQVDAFEGRLREEMANPQSPLAIITDLTSPLDILRKMHQVQNQNSASFHRVVQESDIPVQSRQASVAYDEVMEEWNLVPGQNASKLASQYYLQYENGARPGENLASQLSLDRRHFRMQGRDLLCTTQEKQAAIDRIKSIAEREFPQLIVSSGDPNALSNLAVSGKKTLMDRSGIIIAQGFVKSITVALLAIIVLIGLFFRSWKLAMVSVLPNVLPIAIPLGIFGWSNIILDGPAIVVTSVALGVCVDDTIHFFTKYTNAMKLGKSSQDAISHSMQECGDALTMTTVVLATGFATMLLSGFSPNYLMGVLATSMIVLAWLADFIVTPAVLALMDEQSHAKPATDNPAVLPEVGLENATV